MVKRDVRSQIRRELLRQDKILKKEIKKVLEETAFAQAAVLTAAVQSWKNKPKFSTDVRVGPHELRADVKITGKTKDKNVFHWIDKGTGKFGPKKRSYVIEAKKPGGRLFFRTGYQPKTKPIAKANVGPGKATGDITRPEGVIHPGIKAREFTKTIADNLDTEWKRTAENALRRASRRIKR